jgi:hypothetical protein
MYEKGTDILDCATCQKKSGCSPSVHPYDDACKALLAPFHIGDQIVYETLPAGMVDLDKCSVCSWPVAEENSSMIDDVVDSGVIMLYDSKPFSGDALGAFLFPSKIYWGKTEEDPHGFCDIVVDVPAITKDILLALYAMNVLPS